MLPSFLCDCASYPYKDAHKGGIMVTIQDFIDYVRILLQDRLEPYRYSDDMMVLALDLAFMAASRTRPDMFVSRPIPRYVGKALDTPVDLEPQYREAFMFYMAGQVQLQDQEDTQDARATIFLNKFVSQLLTVAA